MQNIPWGNLVMIILASFLLLDLFQIRSIPIQRYWKVWITVLCCVAALCIWVFLPQLHPVLAVLAAAGATEILLSIRYALKREIGDETQGIPENMQRLFHRSGGARRHDRSKEVESCMKKIDKHKQNMEILQHRLKALQENMTPAAFPKTQENQTETMNPEDYQKVREYLQQAQREGTELSPFLQSFLSGPGDGKRDI